MVTDELCPRCMWKVHLWEPGWYRCGECNEFFYCVHPSDSGFGSRSGLTWACCLPEDIEGVLNARIVYGGAAEDKPNVEVPGTWWRIAVPIMASMHMSLIKYWYVAPTILCLRFVAWRRRVAQKKVDDFGDTRFGGSCNFSDPEVTGRRAAEACSKIIGNLAKKYGPIYRGKERTK